MSPQKLLPKSSFETRFGPHPAPSHACGQHLTASDADSDHGVPHRSLLSDNLEPSEFVEVVAQWLATHHASPEAIEMDRQRREALARQNLEDPVERLPTNLNTRKGNWAEVLLAEYLQALCSLKVPVYRLRYNPNVDQSMKGDDVLGFDLDANPVRIVVGEAKFRAVPSTAVVNEIVSGLEKSHLGNTPASLQFVADRLIEKGETELGKKIADCNRLFAEGKLDLDYVGLLVSDERAHRYVKDNASLESIPKLAIISLSLEDGAGLVEQCYEATKKHL